MQYGIRLAKEDMAFGEFCRLLAGLMADTPLGRVVNIRGEKDKEKIKSFGSYEQAIRKAWREFCSNDRQMDWSGSIEELQDTLRKVFGDD